MLLNAATQRLSTVINVILLKELYQSHWILDRPVKVKIKIILLKESYRSHWILGRPVKVKIDALFKAVLKDKQFESKVNVDKRATGF